MKIVNCKLIIIKTIGLLAIILLLVTVVSPPVYAANCGATVDDPSTLENDTQPCNEGLVPCTGLNCSLCDLFSLVQNIFNFVVWDIVPVLAIVMIIWSGYIFLTSGGNSANVSKGRKMIGSTVIGIAIVYSSYLGASFFIREIAGTTSVASSSFQGNKFLIQCTSNPIPDATQGFIKDGGFSFSVGENVQLPDDINADDVSETEAINLITYKDADIAGLNNDVAASLRQAARSAAPFGVELLVTDGVRTVAEQESLVASNCPVGATRSSNCHPPTCIPVGDGSNCRHTTGKAVDVWGRNSDTGKKCCQDVVQREMGQSSFCVLTNIDDPEPWHFELKSNLIQDESKNPGRLSKFDCTYAN